MDNNLIIYTFIEGATNAPFPNPSNPVMLYDYTYSTSRMNVIPQLSASATHDSCLDNMWNGDQYVIFNKERYFIKQTPSSSKDNTDARWKYDIIFVSERNILSGIYFYDVVTSNTGSDKYASNSSNVLFFGDVHEFAARLNYSLQYSGVDYSVVIDDGISSEAMQVAFEDKFISEAIQEIYNIFDLPYYFVGKVCHIGYTSNAITTVLKYGDKDALLSIQKTNANYKIVNSCTGIGSTDNIPFYYPNPSNDRAAIEAAGGKWITPSTNLMPSIYRTSFGAERFYPAKNNTYTDPETGLKYIFENTYTTKNPHQHKVLFESIKPSIKGMMNGQPTPKPMDKFLQFAYDTNDNDELDEENNFKHPYFFAKLPIYNGTFGFNLFDQAIVGQDMSMSMTNGNCGACNFTIGVSEDQKNIVQVNEDGTLKRKDNGDVETSGSPQVIQNDTTEYEVWIALKKDDNTFGILMPNAGGNYKPSVSDTFVILGIDMPQTYISAAEDRLYKEIIKYMFLNNAEKFTFAINFSRIYLAENPLVYNQLNENARIRIEYNGKEENLYISDYTYKVNKSEALPDITVSLSDTLTVRKGALQTSIDSVKQEIMSSVGNSDFYKQGLKYFVRKDVPDTAEKITYKQGIEIGSYRQNTSGGVFRQNGDGTSHIEVDTILVRVKAFFEQLQINSLKYSGGNNIYSSAAITCSKIQDRHLLPNIDGSWSEVVWDYYRCYFTATQEGTTIKNMFVPGDLARCQEFDLLSKEGIQVTSRFYWAQVVSVGENYIDISKEKRANGSDKPRVGDAIVQLGNISEIDRQNAIIQNSSGINSPSYTMYQGINDFTLEGKDILQQGFDASTGEAFQRIYGESYIGGRSIPIIGEDGKQEVDEEGNPIFSEIKGFVKYTPEEGLEIKGKFTSIGGDGISESFDKINKDVKALQDQIDGAIETWFYNPIPTLENVPASEWITPEIKNTHLGDLYYSEEGKAYRFQMNDLAYEWKVLSDSDITLALANAKKAQDTADGKRRVYIRQPLNAEVYDVGDLWVNAYYGTMYSNDLLRCKVEKEAGIEFNISHWEKAAKYTDDSALNNFVSVVYAGDKAGLETQIDRKIETWFQDADPAIVWATPELKQKHIGDMWYNSSTKLLKNYASTLAWSTIEDQKAIDAYNDASTAQDTADGKRRVFVAQPTILDIYDIGDLWTNATIGSYSNDLLRCKTAKISGVAFNILHWDKASKYTDDSSLDSFVDTIYTSDKNNLINQIDGKIESWFQTTDPALAWTTPAEKAKHVGDMWYNSSTKLLKNYASTLAWSTIEDQKAIDAYNDASTAQDTADGKRRVFTTTPTTPYDVGDLWAAGSSSDLKKCKVARQTGAYVAADWDLATKYTDDTKAAEAQAAADAAKARLDAWAADGTISPTEKQSLKEEIARIDADKSQITADYTRYGLGLATSYNTAHTNYRATLVTLSATTPENITIPSDFATKQTAYYTQRTSSLGAINVASKKLADDAQTAANKGIADAKAAQTAANTANTAITDIKNFTDTAFADGIIDRGEAAAIEKYKNTVNESKKTIQGGYTTLYANSYLTGTAKTGLEIAYDAVIVSITNLLTAIDTAIADKVTTGEEKLAVDTAYATFSTKVNLYYASVETANKSIQDVLKKYSDDAIAAIPDLSYITNALNGNTTVQGGLILTSLLSLGTGKGSEFVTKSGLNGIYNADKTGGGIAFWVGGAMKDRADYTTATMPTDVAKGIDRFDGSGYRANGNMSWNAAGELTVSTQFFKVISSTGITKLEYSNIRDTLDFNANVLLKTGITLKFEGDTTDYISYIKWLKSVFENDTTNKAVKVNGTLYTTGALSAKGLSEGGSGGGGGVPYDRLDAWADYDISKSGYVLSAGLGWDLNTRMNVLESRPASITVNLGSVSYNAVNGIVSLPAYPTTLGWGSITNKPNTIAGYGITDWVISKSENTGMDLNTLNGYGMLSQLATSNATLEKNYPINEAGLLIYGNSAYTRSNQIYGGFVSNRWFVRGAGGDVDNDTRTSWQELLHTGNYTSTLDLTYERKFTKNTAFNKNFGTAAGTIAQGNDSRIINGQTAFSWGNHASVGYALNSALTALKGSGLPETIGYRDVTEIANTLLTFLTGTDTDSIINKWKELELFLAGMTETSTLVTLLGLKANTSLTISAGVGLTGGGNLTTNRSFALATSGVTAGTYKSVTVDVYGRVTAGTNPTTLAGFGITDGVNSVVVSGSGNAVTTATVAGHALTLTKGSTFLEKSTFDDLFEKVNIGTTDTPIWAIKAKLGLYTDHFLSSKGLATGSGGGGGGLDETLLWSILGNTGTEQIAKNHLTTALSGYVLTSDVRLTNDRNPLAHNQAWSTITGRPAMADRWASWAEVTDKPNTFKPEITINSNWDTIFNDSTWGFFSGSINGPILERSVIGISIPLIEVTGFGMQLTASRDKLFFRTKQEGTNGVWNNIYHTGNKPTWDEVINKPTWIGAAKPSYSYSEITGTPPPIDLSKYVTLDTDQLITANKSMAGSFTWNTSRHIGGYAKGLAMYDDKSIMLSSIGFYGATNIFYHAYMGVGDTPWLSNSIRVAANVISSDLPIVSTASILASSFVRSGGNSSQFLKADGSVDSSSYLTYNNNIASATKLATPRTIWGQAFDGTGNVSGSIDNADVITANGYVKSQAGWFQNEKEGCGLYNSAQNARWRAQGGRWESDKEIAVNGNSVWHAGNLLTLRNTLLYMPYSMYLHSPCSNLNNPMWSDTWGTFQTAPDSATNKPDSSDNANIVFNITGSKHGSTGMYGSQLYFNSNGRFQYRNWRSGAPGSWHTIAWTTDNVESANKLYTSRTIFGQSFDGTANVSGALSNCTSISCSGGITCSSFISSGNISVRGSATVDNGIITSYSGGTFTSMVTRTDLIRSVNNQNDVSVYALYRVHNNSGSAIVFGGLATTVGFYGFTKALIDSGVNNTSWNTTWNVDTGRLFHSHTMVVQGSFESKTSITSPTIIGALTGNASSATKLLTALSINGTNFDGTVDIITTKWGYQRLFTFGTDCSGSVNVDGSGNVTFPLTVNTSTKLRTARAINGTVFDGTAAITTNSWGVSRTLTILGDSSGSVSMDGSNNVTLNITNNSSFRADNLTCLTTGKWDCNAPNVAVYYDYGSVGVSVSNKPAGWIYGTLYTLGTNTGINSGLSGQFMWDVQHGSSASGRLWFRTKDNISGWKGWSEIAYKSSNVASSDYATEAGSLRTARTITLTGSASGSTTYDGSANSSLAVTLTGNAPSATKLANARLLWGNSFDGTANIIGTIVTRGSETTYTRIYGDIGSAVDSAVARYEVQWFNDKFSIDTYRGGSTALSKVGFMWNSSNKQTFFPNGDISNTGWLISNTAGCGWRDAVRGGGIYCGSANTVSIYGNKILYNEGYRAVGIAGHNMGFKLYAAEHIGISLACNNWTWGMYCHSNGQLGFGVRAGASDGTGGAINIRFLSTGISVTGNIDATGSIAAKTASDYRLKDICPASVDYCKRLMSIGKVVDYKYNSLAKQRDINIDDRIHTGLIYQNLSNVLPYATYVDSDGFGGINYLNPELLCTTIGAVQMLIQSSVNIAKKTETIENKVLRLENKIKELEAKNGSI